MPLSQKEIDGLVLKLRERYREYAEKFNPTWFNRDAFEERLSMAKRNRMNMEGFILAEISNFEKVREKYEKKRSQKSFSEEVDRIIEENIARIRKYPEIQFHPRAGVEITHFYGALQDLIFVYIPIFRVVLNDSTHRRIIDGIEERLEFLALPRGNLPSRRIETHALVLDRKGTPEIEIERDRNEYLKAGAFILHELADFTEGLLENRNPDWELPLRLDKLFLEESRRKRVVNVFSGTTGYGAILRVSEYAGCVIDDFRLRAIRQER